jgi:hypothetical protein
VGVEVGVSGRGSLGSVFKNGFGIIPRKWINRSCGRGCPSIVSVNICSGRGSDDTTESNAKKKSIDIRKGRDFILFL